MKENLYDRIGELLKTKEEYKSEDGDLLKAKVYSDIMTMDKNLLSLLLSDEEVKKTFFLKVDDTLVFDKQKFAWIIDSKEFLPDSYTAYTNKIGLTSDGDFISQKNDVVLDFPYKDCVLEGGQTKGDQNRKEIFYNETLAQDEIRRMLDPKVFTKAKRYTKGGVEENIKFDEKDNLIIKGNNLIALSSLLERYEGKVKCIYIDPPYNTGSDSFGYNDSFNHSTWLTFMKNRLEFAKKLLSENGVIFVQCDDNEQAYLKVLMDEVFDISLFCNMIVWKKVKSAKSQSKNLSKISEYIICYSKSENYEIKKLFLQRDEKKDEKLYRYKDEDGRIYRLSDFTQKGQGEARFFGDRLIEPPEGKHWIWSQERIDEGMENNLIVFSNNGTPSVKRYLDEKKGIPLGDLWIDDDVQIISSTSKERIKFDGQKPENLIKRVLDISTNELDLVLDFHIGTGTIAAVAHKMGRRYIGIEQMDYIEDITVERLKKVIDGEQGGISKAVDWEGGGSFVYCELMENGNELIREIENADENTIKDVKAKIYRDERIVPYITREELEQADKDFEELNLKEKKKALIKIVDKNKLYVNYSDIDSGDFDISEADKKFTKSFYEVD